MKPFRVAPDGALLDRAAEFAYSKKATARALFEADPNGYTDAVAKLVQTLASSEKIVTGERKTTPFATTNLKETLASAGRHEYSAFFAPDAVDVRQKAAMQWLKLNWTSITDELQDPDSAVASAVLGHLRREFYMYWLKVDKDWNPVWYSPEKESLLLPSSTCKSFVRAVGELAHSENFPVSEQNLEQWIQQNITSHFRIFGEYWLFMGNETEDEYLPALTRSSLGFLTQKGRHGSIETLMMPFLGFTALEKVTHREGMIESVIEWSQTEGKEIVEGMDRLQEIFRTTKTAEKRKTLLAEVEGILTSKLSWQFRLVLNAIKLVTDSVAQKPDVATAEKLAEIATSKSYRWLYRIRTPELEWQWRKRLEELLEK